jgi:hypothetical protein
MLLHHHLFKTVLGPVQTFSSETQVDEKPTLWSRLSFDHKVALSPDFRGKAPEK